MSIECYSNVPYGASIAQVAEVSFNAKVPLFIFNLRYYEPLKRVTGEVTVREVIPPDDVDLLEFPRSQL